MRAEKWFIGGSRIEIVRGFKYLGYHFASNNQPNDHIKVKLADATAAMGYTWSRVFRNKNINLENKWKLFNAVARIIHEYGVEIWGAFGGDETEILQNKFIKRVLSIPGSTPNYVLSTELGMVPAKVKQMDRQLSYLSRV